MEEVELNPISRNIGSVPKTLKQNYFYESITNLSSLLCLYGIQFFDTIRTIFHQLYTNIILNYLKQYFRLVSISTYSWNFRTPGTRVTRDDFIDVEVGVVGRVPSIQRHFRATWAPFRPHLWIWPLCSSMFKITLHLGWTSLSLDDGGEKRESHVGG